MDTLRCRNASTVSGNAGRILIARKRPLVTSCSEACQPNDAGQVELELKTPWRDGMTHLIMSPLDFMQRLAALVPRPKLHLIRFDIRVTSPREVSGPRCANMACWPRTPSCGLWWCRIGRPLRRKRLRCLVAAAGDAAPHVGSTPEDLGSTHSSRPNEPHASRRGPAESGKGNGAGASCRPSRQAPPARPELTRALERQF